MRSWLYEEYRERYLEVMPRPFIYLNSYSSRTTRPFSNIPLFFGPRRSYLLNSPVNVTMADIMRDLIQWLIATTESNFDDDDAT